MLNKPTRRAVAVLAAVAAAVAAVVASIAAGAMLSSGAAVVGATTVQIDGQSRQVDGENVRRLTNYLVIYSNAGTRTGTNRYGFEAAVVDGKVTQIQDGVGNMLIPANGYVLSGHGDDRTWLKARAQVGDVVTTDRSNPTTTAPPPTTTPPTTTNPPPTGTALLPDVGIRTLRSFQIVTSNGRKLLKFPVVTSNVGKGPLEVRGTRSSSTSTDWTASQVIRNSDGSTTTIPTNVTFYYAGDGHTHFHMRDFDGYELFDPSGKKIKEGEKHGYCFEDNTSYRDWPGRVAGSPSSPVYTHAASCGQGNPSATSITHGLSVGWGDTYPVTLPDQAIDVTGLADGNYRVVITADQFGGIRESDEGNNSATAIVKITGNTVTLVSANDGL